MYMHWGGGVYSHLSDPSSLNILVLSEISCVIWRIRNEVPGSDQSKRAYLNTFSFKIFLTSFVLKLRPCIPCLQKARTLSWRQTAETSTILLDCCWQHTNWFNSYLINILNQLIFRNVVWFMRVLPVASIWKLKVSSADNFLLDFNLPWRFTIFIHPADGQVGICSIAQIFKIPHSTNTVV